MELNALLIQGKEPEIYIKDQGQIRHISNPKVFKSMGLDYIKINKIPEKELRSFPEGGPVSGFNDLSPELKEIIISHIYKYNLYADIVIVNYNTLTHLKRCLKSIYENTFYPYRIIIIDNNSSDGSCDYLNKIKNELALTHDQLKVDKSKQYTFVQNFLNNNKTGNFTLICNDLNIGCASAWNQGLRIGKGIYIVLLNPDTEVTPYWLYPLIKEAVKEDIAIVGTKHVNRSEKVIHAGVISKDNTLINRTAIKDGPNVYSKPIDVEFVYGACFLIKRNLIPDLGFFDEDYFLYAEESDYCLNARKKGFRVRYCPVKIYHYEKGAPINPEERNKHLNKSLQHFKNKWKT